MPQPGEIRRGATESVQWDGSRWQPIEHVDPAAAGGYHPDLADSEHPWLARLKGFLSGAADAATPAKLGAIGALAVPEVGVPLALAGSVGGTAIADLAKSHFGSSTAPQSAKDYLTDIGEAAAGPALTGAGGAAADALMSGGLSGTKAGALTGGAVGALEGARHGGVTGAIEGGITGALGGGTLGKLAKLSKFFGMAGEAAPAAEAAAAEEGGFVGGSRARNPEQWRSLSDPLPETGHFDKPAYDPQSFSMEDLAPSPVDQHMPNTSGYDPLRQGLENDIAYPRKGDQQTVDEVLDRYMPNSGASSHEVNVQNELPDASPIIDRYAPNTSGYEPPAPVRTTPASIEALTPEEVGQQGIANFRSGAGLPGSAQPSELQYEPPFPDTHVYDSELGMSVPKNQQFDVIDHPEPDIEGQETPDADDVESLVRGLLPQPKAPAPSLKQVDRGDSFWGPGSTTRTGAPSQADETSKLLYDPQTPSEYLRFQLQTATDPAEREFLAKALSQRYRMQARPGKMRSVRATPR